MQFLLLSVFFVRYGQMLCRPTMSYKWFKYDITVDNRNFRSSKETMLFLPILLAETFQGFWVSDSKHKFSIVSTTPNTLELTYSILSKVACQKCTGEETPGPLTPQGRLVRREGIGGRTFEAVALTSIGQWLQLPQEKNSS